jgi:DNA-binding GntR family transcriptional regulator
MVESSGPQEMEAARRSPDMRDFQPRARPVVKRQRISDWVYDEICEAIRDMSLPPGTPISEPSLAAQLNVSRAPVREALTRLADQRLVVVTPQVGTRVAPILMGDVAEACFVRSALEVSAFETAVARPDLDTTELRRIFEAGARAAQEHDAEGFFEADEQLHQKVFALAGFPHVWDVLRGVKLNLDRLRRLHLADALDNPDITAEHRTIVDSLEKGDLPTGLQAIRRHAHRILTDSDDAFRSRSPEYFEE